MNENPEPKSSGFEPTGGKRWLGLHRAARLAGAGARVFKRLAAAIDLLNSFDVACEGRRATRNDRRLRASWYALCIQVCMGATDGSRSSAVAFGTAAGLGNHHPDTADRRDSFLGSSDPKNNLHMMAALALVVAFLSASQDIVIDAWRVEGTECGSTGFRGFNGSSRLPRRHMLVSGVGSLLIANYAGWFAAYATMAALVGAGLVVFLLVPEPKVCVSASRAAGIRLGCGSPRAFESSHQSLSRFYAAAAFGRSYLSQSSSTSWARRWRE